MTVETFEELFLMERVFLKMASVPLVYEEPEGQMTSPESIGINERNENKTEWRTKPTMTSDPQVLVLLKLNSTMWVSGTK